MKGKEAMTDAERMREVRKKKESAGWRQFNLWLSPESQLSLDETVKRLEVLGEAWTLNDIINQAISGNKPLDHKSL